MEFQHSPRCLHCQAGCTHDHNDGDPLITPFDLLTATTVPCVPGSRMRHGGSFTIPKTDITIASDNWRRTRCPFCGKEAMVPAELVPPFIKTHPDGALLGHCGGCQYDMSQGQPPGHGHHRRRR